MVADVGGAFAEAGGFFDFAQLFELCFEAHEGVGGADVGVAASFEEVGAVGELEAAEVGWACGERAEEELGAFLNRRGGGFDGEGGDLLGAEHGFGVAGELVEAGVGECDAEVLAGDVFELVGFVEDDGGGFREDACVGCAGGLLLDAEVGEEEVVVDDDDVGFERFAAHAGDVAGLPVGAGLAEADLGAGVDLVPEGRVLGERVDLGAVAGDGHFFPREDVVELVDLVQAR